MRVDLHTHALPASGDARMTLDTLLSAATDAEVDGIALTDHGAGADYAYAEEVLGGSGIAVVPGREVSSPLGHVLVLTTDRGWLVALPPRVELPLPRTAAAPVALVWAHPAGWQVGGFTIPPDPARGAEHVHAVEVLNGERLWQRGGVDAAVRLGADHGLASTGGSDAHDPAVVGRCLTSAPGARDAAEFVEALIAGAVRPVLSRSWAAANDTMYQRADLAPYLA